MPDVVSLLFDASRGQRDVLDYLRRSAFRYECRTLRAASPYQDQHEVGAALSSDASARR